MTTFVCIASGPSLSKNQILSIARSHEKGDIKVIAVSDNYRVAPWADYVYSCDFTWWKEYYEDVVSRTSAEIVTQDRTAHSIRMTKGRINPLPRNFKEYKVEHKSGLSGKDDALTHGGNSGYQAVHLAYLLGATKIILVGYDMQHTGGKRHWFGDHPEKFIRNADKPELWKVSMKKLASDIQANGVELVNATIETAIPDEVIKRQCIDYALHK